MAAQPPGEGPAFLLPSSLPLMVKILSRALRIASTAALDLDFTLHSLRRGASQACDKLSLDLSKIMQAGTWKSQAVISYLDTTVIEDAPAAISTLLG